jgi:hypothetical protein
VLLIACGTEIGRIGDACVSHGQCPAGKTRDSPGFCSYSFPNGYCTRPCASDGDCDEGSICAASLLGNACVRSCSTSSECRVQEGYSCSGTSGSGRRFCTAN